MMDMVVCMCSWQPRLPHATPMAPADSQPHRRAVDGSVFKIVTAGKQTSPQLGRYQLARCQKAHGLHNSLGLGTQNGKMEIHCS